MQYNDIISFWQFRQNRELLGQIKIWLLLNKASLKSHRKWFVKITSHLTCSICYTRRTYHSKIGGQRWASFFTWQLHFRRLPWSYTWSWVRSGNSWGSASSKCRRFAAGGRWTRPRSSRGWSPDNGRESLTRSWPWRRTVRTRAWSRYCQPISKDEHFRTNFFQHSCFQNPWSKGLRLRWLKPWWWRQLN